MKKFLAALSGALVIAVTAVGFSACDSTKPEDGAVTLVGITAASAIGTMDVDYYVVAEPAATARANAAGLEFVGDLQELYGSSNGYPQAVIVAKNSLIESNSSFIDTFIYNIQENTEWLATAETSTIIEAISSHLPENTSPTFSAQTLNSSVIANCGINFVAAQQDEERVRNYISAVGQVDSAMVGNMADGFFYTPQATPTSTTSTVEVYMPDGAPALALARLMAEDMQFGNTVNYHVVVADTIASFVNGENPKADICVLPSNAASKLLGNNSSYTMLGTVTNGNLYILSKNGEEITSNNIKTALSGKTVGVIQLANVPGLTFKLILNKYGLSYIDPSEI